MVMLTEHQAYAAVLLFLKREYKLTGSDDVATMMSGMHLVAEDDNCDPAYWEEWMEDVEKVMDASQTAESWEEFEEKYLAYKLMSPDGTELRARPGLPKEPEEEDFQTYDR